MALLTETLQVMKINSSENKMLTSPVANWLTSRKIEGSVPISAAGRLDVTSGIV